MSGATMAAAGCAGAATAAPPLAVTVDPSTAAGNYEPEFGIGITNAVTVTITGGAAPYGGAWSKVSGATFTVRQVTPTEFYFQLDTPATQTAVYRYTATDSLGQTAHDDVNVSMN